MTLNVYAIHDKLAQSYSNPFVLDTRIALRTFRHMVEERSLADCEDREVVLLGTYDTETGEIESLYQQYQEVAYDMEQAKRDMEEKQQ